MVAFIHKITAGEKDMEHITLIKEFSQAAERIVGKSIDEKFLAEMLSHSQTKNNKFLSFKNLHNPPVSAIL